LPIAVLAKAVGRRNSANRQLRQSSAADAPDKVDIFEQRHGPKPAQDAVKPPADQQTLVAIRQTQAPAAPRHFALQVSGPGCFVIQRELAVGRPAPVLRLAHETVGFPGPTVGQPGVSVQEEQPVPGGPIGARQQLLAPPLAAADDNSTVFPRHRHRAVSGATVANHDLNRPGCGHLQRSESGGKARCFVQRGDDDTQHTPCVAQRRSQYKTGLIVVCSVLVLDSLAIRCHFLRMEHIGKIPRSEARLPEGGRPPGPLFRGRAAGFNPPNRFETTRRDPFFDGWQQPDQDQEEDVAVPTTVTVDSSRTVIARNQSPDLGFDRSINPYRGCEHGCIYCFARPTHAWLGLSPGVDFETKLFAKPDAAALLRRELSLPSYAYRPVAMGTNTDPYQPVERERRITRDILKVLSDCNHPVTIVTKSALIERDIDILAPMAVKGLCAVGISVTTLDRSLARTMEPRTSTPSRRLATIRSLSEAGIPVRIMVAPVVPGITDHELEAILEAGRDAGASLANYILLRLPGEVKDLFVDWLETHFPARKNKVLNTIRSLRDGKLNNAQWGERMVGKGPFGKAIDIRFATAVRRLGLKREGKALRTDLFRKPERDDRQLSLF